MPCSKSQISDLFSERERYRIQAPPPFPRGDRQVRCYTPCSSYRMCDSFKKNSGNHAVQRATSPLPASIYHDQLPFSSVSKKAAPLTRIRFLPRELPEGVQSPSSMSSATMETHVLDVESPEATLERKVTMKKKCTCVWVPEFLRAEKVRGFISNTVRACDTTKCDLGSCSIGLRRVYGRSHTSTTQYTRWWARLNGIRCVQRGKRKQSTSSSHQNTSPAPLSRFQCPVTTL